MITINTLFDLPLCLIGDFNARTGVLKDYANDEQSDILEDALFSPENVYDMPLPERCNKDRCVNKNGEKLIDICKSFDLSIINGRVGSDVSGNFTCANASTIDYCLVSRKIFHNVQDFEVACFDDMISDKHNAIHLLLSIHDIVDDIEQANNENKESVNVRSSDKIKKCFWEKSLAADFLKSLDKEKIDEICCKMTVDIKVLTQESVDKLCDSITDVYIDAATKVNMVKVTKANCKSWHDKPKNVKTMPWFNNTCRKLRSEFMKLKKKCKGSGKSWNEELANVKKSYKKELKHAKYVYFKETHEKLRALKTQNPREYWKLLNPKENRSNKCPIDIETFKNHFQLLNEKEQLHMLDNPDFSQFDLVQNDDLNKPILQEEVIRQIKKLKNNKASGVDLIVNEYLKNSSKSLLCVITRFFNIILDTGIVPTNWTLGLICPIYKKKGSANDPDNYRGITLLSCLGKLFTSIINERLSSLFNDDNLMGEEQAGFRENYSTTDHIFVLHSIIDFYLSQKNRIYCAFIDYKKAFDSINRSSLWYKMIQNNIKGNIFRVIRNMYSNLKSCVMSNSRKSDFFNCNIGVRQGENLSPFLFALYINDFELFVRDRYNGVDLLPQNLRSLMLNSGVDVFLKLFSLLYADDTILLSTSEEEMQMALSAVSEYCKTWSLQVNANKTKIVIFSRGKVKKYEKFKFDENIIEVVDDYTYLGVVFNYKNDFKKAMNKQISQAKRAMYSLMAKAGKLQLPIDIQLDLFDRLVIPILVYGSEIWGWGNLSQIEILHMQFCKYILRLKKSTMNYMVLGELGRVEVSLTIKERMINYWLRTINGKECKLSTIVCNVLKLLDDQGIYSSPWIIHIKSILRDLGMPNIWHEHKSITMSWLKRAVKFRLTDSFRQIWQGRLNESNQCINYRIFKTSLNLERYLLRLTPTLRFALAKFRCGNHRLPVNTGRYTGIERKDRICQLCSLNKMGDEFHYLFECTTLCKERNLFIKPYYRNRPNVLKMDDLFNSVNYKEMKRLAQFCIKIMSLFKK